MWLRLDSIMLWIQIIAEAHARKGISDEELELWHEYSRKYITLMDRLIKRFEWNEESNRMRDDIDAMEKDVEKVTRKAMSNLLGFTYPPSENAVIFAFGRLYGLLEPVLARALMEEDSFDRLEFRAEYPDAEIVKGDKRLRIEFETHSSEFKRHFHDEKGCNLIICWMHDWHECPLKVLDLHELTVYETPTVAKRAL